jgi:hypothetical protein
MVIWRAYAIHKNNDNYIPDEDRSTKSCHSRGPKVVLCKVQFGLNLSEQRYNREPNEKGRKE